MNPSKAATPKTAIAAPRWVIQGLTFGVWLVVFGVAPLPGGDDWQTIANAAQRLATGQPLYGVQAPHYYANPPHFAVLVMPLAWLPLGFSLALLRAGSLTLTLLLVQRWCPEDVLFKFGLTTLSPPMLYILLHGEIDIVMLAGLFLPSAWWGLVAITKPNLVIGLAFHSPPRQWFKAGVMVGVVMVASFLLLGNWVSGWLAQGQAIGQYPHNLWRDLWPFQVPLGIFFLLQGLRWREERYLIASSPFLVPYANMGNLIGCWLIALSDLNKWQCTALFASWWAVVLLRMLG